MAWSAAGIERHLERRQDGHWIWRGNKHNSAIQALREHLKHPGTWHDQYRRQCGVEDCWNPAHFAQYSSRTHCPKGHPYTPENLAQNGAGKKRCRTCHRQRMAARRMKQKGEAS